MKVAAKRCTCKFFPSYCFDHVFRAFDHILDDEISHGGLIRC